MNASDILKYGHLTIMHSLDGLPDDAWEVEGVCGVWSVKAIMAHLASYEAVLAELFGQLIDDAPAPLLQAFTTTDGDSFNAVQVGQREDATPADVLAEYVQHHAQVMALLPQLPDGALRTNGILPWYGAAYDLEDFLVYTFYGHKREHAAQIAVFRDEDGV